MRRLGVPKPRRVAAVLLLVVFAAILIPALLDITDHDRAYGRDSDHYLARGVTETGAVNIVSSVLIDYRGFDTLGEATVIFAAVAAITALLAGGSVPETSNTLSVLVRCGIAYLMPIFWIFPIYVILNGHLSPGGGFHGGVALTVFLILVSVVYGMQFSLPRVSLRVLSAVEYMSALTFVLVGVAGAVQGAGYLANLTAGFPAGTPGALMSAGVIPILNLVIGCKVAAGLGSIFYNMVRREA